MPTCPTPALSPGRWRRASTWPAHSTWRRSPTTGSRSCDPARPTGSRSADWRAKYPPASAGSIPDPFELFSPGGESWATFLVRAGAALSRLTTRHEDERVVAVTHGGVVEASFYLALGLGPTSVRTTFATANTSITHWQHQQTPTGHRAWRLITFNDARHLD